MAITCRGQLTLTETEPGGGECDLGEECEALAVRHIWAAYRAAHAGRIIVVWREPKDPD